MARGLSPYSSPVYAAPQPSVVTTFPPHSQHILASSRIKLLILFSIHHAFLLYFSTLYAIQLAGKSFACPSCLLRRVLFYFQDLLLHPSPRCSECWLTRLTAFPSPYHFPLLYGSLYVLHPGGYPSFLPSSLTRARLLASRWDRLCDTVHIPGWLQLRPLSCLGPPPSNPTSHILFSWEHSLCKSS